MAPALCSKLVWMRRDLRLHDHAALHLALSGEGVVQPVFIFDTEILAHFPSPDDRRLSFLAEVMCDLDAQLAKRGGGLLLLHGKPAEIHETLVGALGHKQLIAAEDYEPGARARDAMVGKRLSPGVDVRFIKDQVVRAPLEILREGQAYKVFTPYSKAWRAGVSAADVAALEVRDAGRYANIAAVRGAAKDAGLTVLEPQKGAGEMLARIGYRHREDALWPATGAGERLKDFIAHKAKRYADDRNPMALPGTSRLSPYLRFGLVSARQCARAAMEAGADTWLSELIWREFYAMILYHYPESQTTEWNPRYRGVLAWRNDERLLEAWKAGKTGYPVVDAAMRQLLEEGWMHNRARMIVASFLTKHLRIDWRLGESHFAQWLMDYDMASNVGGWQWAASTGTDAQPYFRVFNPTLQSEKFDPKGEYIRRYVPELAKAPDKAIHAPWESPLLAPYLPPIVKHEEARAAAIAMFKAVSGPDSAPVSGAD